MSAPAPLTPTPEPSSAALRPDGKREAIVPLDVRGRFIRARRVVFAALMAVYIAIPFAIIGGHPAVHLDVPGRRFFLLGGSFNAQDVWMVALLVLAFLFSLLLVTAWRGRLWCGWACPQTVFLEGLYRPIERLFEGSRSRRLRAAGHPRGAGDVARSVGKHASFVALSLLLGHAALIPFVPLGTMPALFRDGPGAHPLAFAWAMALSALFYFDFSWFREQFCLVLCPYGRLQSVLHDNDSIIIGYDTHRGEPRAPIRRPALRIAEEAPRPAGDCIDCKKCVWACPTGIDIRNGFQMECIACAQCIDVCDEVMDKVARPRGLIRTASLNQLEGKPSRVARPRLFIYAILAGVTALAFVASVALRTPFEANVLRPVGVPWALEGTRVRNQVQVHLVNKRSDARRYQLTIVGPDGTLPPGLAVHFDNPAIALRSLDHTRIAVSLVAERSAVDRGLPLVLVVRELDTGVEQRTPLRFLAPLAPLSTR
jgi:cytochrome c oxidase accessory protein FixG